MAQTKQQKELIVLGVLVVLAASLWYVYYGRPTKASSGLTATGGYTPINAQDYIVLINDLEKAQKTEYKTSGRNIFVIRIDARGGASQAGCDEGTLPECWPHAATTTASRTVADDFLWVWNAAGGRATAGIFERGKRR